MCDKILNFEISRPATFKLITLKSQTMRPIFGFLIAAFFVVVFDQWSRKFFVNSFISVIATQNHIKTPHNRIKSSQKSSLSFPENFKFGVSTSAHQIEGAWNVDGKTPSTWDVFAHEHPDLIDNGTNADVSTDSYHFYNEDLEAVNFVGVRKINQ